MMTGSRKIVVNVGDFKPVGLDHPSVQKYLPHLAAIAEGAGGRRAHNLAAQYHLGKIGEARSLGNEDLAEAHSQAFQGHRMALFHHIQSAEAGNEVPDITARKASAVAQARSMDANQMGAL